ncbi:probable ATP-dependent RNA helicase spindle-E isoform X2 [Diabrotica virgifera virgifera]|nr:probable ATP-dependent RNA helicase spindle-E isoform X2 [Diabrotica virgifera virgifera]
MNKLLENFHKIPVIPTGQVNGVVGISTEDDYSSTDESEEEEGEEYEQEYVAEEKKKYASFKVDQEPSTMSEVEGVDGITFKNNPLHVYSQYSFNTTSRKKELPIDDFKDKILYHIGTYNVVIIHGPTGCGKTTQVPQFILDYCRDEGKYCNIAVTQPRKIATINIAKRVCEERGWAMGTVCGYQVGLEKKLSPDSILTYMTTGVLLQKIIHLKRLTEYTHIIIDEIHERTQELDFLLLLIRKFLYAQNSTTKIILMSATIKAEEFANYFQCKNDVSFLAPIIQVDKDSNFTKTLYYLEDLKSVFDTTKAAFPTFDIDKPEISEGLWKVFTCLVSLIDRFDFKDKYTNELIIGSILVFLPGIYEIEEAHKYLREHSETYAQRQNPNRIKWDIIPLHSSLPNDELAKAFLPTKKGFRKVILSTNIAESSITVPDSYYVIDFCMTKSMTIDPITKYMSLRLEWGSQVNCEQRAGRVGRIGDGRVYRLVPRDFYEQNMAASSIPDILRAPLERVVLQAKMLELNDTPQQILSLAMNPPNLKNIRMTILSLKEAGALLQTCRNEYKIADGDLTFLGHVMASLPVDINLSKLIVFGHLFNCLQEAIIMATGCSIQNIFSIPFQKRFAAYQKLFLWADDSFSDLIALLNLYQVWQTCKADGSFDVHGERQWCSKNLVSLKGLREWQQMVKEINQRLEFLNIKQIHGQTELQIDEKPLVLKMIIAGAFYPNFFIREQNANEVDDKQLVRAVGGRDPYRSVYLTGMDSQQPGPVYIRAIKSLFKNENDRNTNISIGFDSSNKIYVEFKVLSQYQNRMAISINGRQMVADTILGKIPREVYEAIRKRQLQHQFQLQLLPLKEAWKYAEEKGFTRKSALQKLAHEDIPMPSTFADRNCFSLGAHNPIPGLDVEWITLKITEYEDAGHFWANNLESEPYLTAIEEILNKAILHSVVSRGQTVEVGSTYAARFVEDNMFYRCKVFSVSPTYAEVRFIDYGNMQRVPIKEIYLLPNRPECSFEPLAIECALHGIKPSRKANIRGIWSEATTNFVKKHTFNILLYGRVHSVVDKVVYLEVYKRDPHMNNSKSLNLVMLEDGWAEPAIESYHSRDDSNNRQKVYASDNPRAEAVRLSFDKVQSYDDFDAPQMSTRGKTIYLKGPHSPLEMKVYSCLESSNNKTIDVEGSSINTVLLDTAPQDPHTRLLVAAYVSQSANSDHLKLRQTTLMPNIPGLPMLLTLLFCPKMSPKVTDDGTKVASILCGLGYDPITLKSYYPSHDFILTLDTELTEDEVNRVNCVRFAMNQGLKVMAEVAFEHANPRDMLLKQKELKNSLMELLHADRRSVERSSVPYANVWHKNNFESTILTSGMDENQIWPLLDFVKLCNREGYHPEVSKNLNDLDLMARKMLPAAPIQCYLCRVELLFVHDVRFHLISKDHKERVAAYNPQYTIKQY